MLELINVKFAYTVNGKTYAVTTAEDVGNSRVSLTVSDDGEKFGVSLRTKSEIEIVKLAAVFRYDFTESDSIFLNGYQSWTDSHEHGVNDKLRGIDHIPAPIAEKYSFAAYGDYRFARYSSRRGKLHGFSYGYIRSDNGIFDFIGSLNESDGFTRIMTDTVRGTVTVEKECEGLRINGGYNGISLYMGNGSETYVFDRYFELMQIPKTSESPVFGYTSWYRHYQDICEKYIECDLEGVKNCGVKADIFQIDDGYQTAVGDWLSIDMAKFPNGIKAVADMINEAGMTPGLWLAPFVCEEKSELFRDHKDWLLTDENGVPVKAGCNWSGAYALDIYNDEVREYLREVFRTVTEEWGFKLLKLDFLYAACVLPRRDRTRGRIMSDGMDFLREIAGSAKILGCGVPMASAFGKVDYCRVGADVTPEWDGTAAMKLTHRERPSTRNTILNAVFRRQLNGRAFINDPDVFMLRGTSTSMTTEQRRCLAEINALCGGVLFTSDDMNEYGEEQNTLLDGMLELRGAEVLSARADGDTLTVAVRKDDRYFVKAYNI